MIIPIRCFTCGKILGDKWRKYREEVEKNGGHQDTIIDINSKTIKETLEGKAMDKLNIKRYCCRRIMLGHVDLMKDIMN